MSKCDCPLCSECPQCAEMRKKLDEVNALYAARTERHAVTIKELDESRAEASRLMVRVKELEEIVGEYAAVGVALIKQNALIKTQHWGISDERTKSALPCDKLRTTRTDAP